tara:strand:+ start:8618 stop:9217 length:600 start_codon:yes stop_codon:yes gene_type:complete
MIEIISKDNIHVKLSDKEAKYSQMIFNLFYCECDENSENNGEKKINEIMPLNYISGEQLQKLKLLLEHLIVFNLNDETIKNVDSYNYLNYSIISILDITEDFTMEKLFKFVDICNYLDIPVLLEILKMKILSLIENKTDDEISEKFDIDKNALIIEENIEEYIKQNEIYDIMETYKLDKKDFTKKENEAIGIMKEFLCN